MSNRKSFHWSESLAFRQRHFYVNILTINRWDVYILWNIHHNKHSERLEYKHQTPDTLYQGGQPGREFLLHCLDQVKQAHQKHVSL